MTRLKFGARICQLGEVVVIQILKKFYWFGPFIGYMSTLTKKHRKNGAGHICSLDLFKV